MDYREKSEIRDGMRIDWDMPIKMEDGSCCDATSTGRSPTASIP